MPPQRANVEAVAPASDTATIRIEENKKELAHKPAEEPVRLAVSPMQASPVKTPPPPPPAIPRASLSLQQNSLLPSSAQRTSLVSSQPLLSSITPSPRKSLTSGQSSLLAPGSPRRPSSSLADLPKHIAGEGSSASIGKHASFLLHSEGENFEVTVFRPQTRSIMKRTAALIEGPDGELEIAPEEPPPSPVGPAPPLKHVGFTEGDVTGELEPEDDLLLDSKADSSDRSKSIDWGNQLDLDRDSEEGAEDTESKRQSYRDRLRERGGRKGRLFSEKAEKADKNSDMSPEEAAFTAETDQLVRNRDQLEVDVYALEQDIREKNRELEKKKKQLVELLATIRARPFIWAKVLDPTAPDPPSEKASDNGSPKRQPRGSLNQSDSDPQIVRIHVQKMGNLFSKDAKRVLELNQLIKIISLHKLKKDGRTEVIHAHQIHSCKAPDKNSPILNFKYYGDSDRKLLRTQKEFKLKFDTIFERERIYRVLREMLPTEKRSSSFTYSPQPLPISEKTQDRVNALPVFRLAGVLHDAWIERKESMGWKHGLNQDEVEKTHPQMKVFEQLTPEDQKFCMGMATLTLAGIFELGYSITKAQGNQKGFAPQLRSLIEFLAENAHESWADIKIKSGWRHDSRADSTSKSHPDLVPYCDLDENAKDPDREAALTIISSLIKWGYCITRNSGDNFDTDAS